MPATRTALITFLLSSVALAVAPAQSSSRPVSLGVEGGWSAPAGSAQAFKRGYQLGGLAEFRTPLAWIAIRVDGGYQSLGSTTAAATNEPTRWFNGSDAAVGLEASFARVVAFTEARYQSLAGTPRRFVPITLGLRSP